MAKIWITKTELKALVREMIESDAKMCEGCDKLMTECQCSMSEHSRKTQKKPSKKGK